jgi:sulfur carrier protein
MNATTERLGIVLNGSPHDVAGPATLLALLGGLGLSEKRGVAAAVNGEVVPRAAWETRMLAERDRVVVIRATQGG